MTICGFAHVVFACLVISFIYGFGASNDTYQVDLITAPRAESQGPTGFCRATDAGGIVQIRNHSNITVCKAKKCV